MRMAETGSSTSPQSMRALKTRTREYLPSSSARMSRSVMMRLSSSDRRFTPQSNGWALDDVKLALKPLMQEEVDHCDELLAERPNAFLVHQLMLEGAEWEGGRLVPSDEIRCLLEVVLFEWKCEKGGKENTVQVPIYLNESRSELLAVVEMPHVESISEDMWRQRAVAFIAWRQA